MQKCFIVLFIWLCVQAGMGGHYVLDEYGDRDVNFSIIYTSANTAKVKPLFINQLTLLL